MINQLQLNIQKWKNNPFLFVLDKYYIEIFIKIIKWIQKGEIKWILNKII